MSLPWLASAPLPNPNPLFLLCFPFPLGTTQPPTSRGEEEHQGGNFLPPTQPQTELHLHVTPGWLRGGRGGAGGR